MARIIDYEATCRMASEARNGAYVDPEYTGNRALIDAAVRWTQERYFQPVRPIVERSEVQTVDIQAPTLPPRPVPSGIVEEAEAVLKKHGLTA